MKIAIEIKALSTRHSFVGDEPKYFLELDLLGHMLKVQISDTTVESIDQYITSKQVIAAPQGDYVDERVEYPSSYDEGVDYEYELGAVSLNDMEDL